MKSLKNPLRSSAVRVIESLPSSFPAPKVPVFRFNLAWRAQNYSTWPAWTFEKAERPEVDVKNFKSALFVIHLGDVTPGDEAKVSLTSDFFISSTQFYVFNETLPQPWIISDAANLSLPDRVQELVVTVKDGGPLDSDGKADGRITLVGGPRDSFWGYALGTLFIRFFGIFIVLSVLMLGMIFSGLVFQWLARRKAAGENKKTAAIAPQIKEEHKRSARQLLGPGGGRSCCIGFAPASCGLAKHRRSWICPGHPRVPGRCTAALR